MNIKNIRGHLPDLSYKDTESVYYVVCHTVTLSWKPSQKTLPGHKKHTNINDIKELCNNKHVA